MIPVYHLSYLLRTLICFFLLVHVFKPLPELIVERVLKRRHSNDESEEFNCSLKKRMKLLITKLFSIERDGNSSPIVLPVYPFEKKQDNLLETNDESNETNRTLISSKEETTNAERCDKSYNIIQDDKKIDEVEIMRSHNLSLSTQSLETASNSSSSLQKVHLERRNEIISTHSWVSDRDSGELDIAATTPMDTGFLEDSPSLFRCSTPIDHKHSDDNLDFNCSPVLHLNSERRHNEPTNSSVGEQASDEEQNVPSANEEIDAPETLKAKEVEPTKSSVGERASDEEQNVRSANEEIDAPETLKAKEVEPTKSSVGEQASDKEQNVPSTNEEINAPQTLKAKEMSVQTDRMEQHVIDIGVQVQEREREVRSVQVQTDEDNVFLKRGPYYFIFL